MRQPPRSPAIRSSTSTARMTHASSDGWTENIAAPGQAVLDTYPNDQRAAMLWYHDHVMGVTALQRLRRARGPLDRARRA